MSLSNIWDEPIVSPSKLAPTNDNPSPLKRPHQSLFLSGSDSDNERPPKRATPAPRESRPDIDALFEDLDKDGDTSMGAIVEEQDLRYQPLAPALDLAKLAREAEAKHARSKRSGVPALTPHQILPSSSPPPEGFGAGGLDKSGKDTGKEKSGDAEGKKVRKKPLKLDEARLVGTEGFPQLIKDSKGFKPKGKGHEHTDLNRILQVYQFWTHKMYPKEPFKETVDRVEKLCHSKRMQVRLSVWRDEAKGLVNGRQPDDDPDVIDLTEPTLVGTEDDKEPENHQPTSDGASSRAPSLPPASSDAEDDDFDIDAIIRAEEDRLATLRATTSGSGSAQTSPTPKPPAKASYRENPDANAVDIDEAALWDDLDPFDGPQPLSNPPQSTTPSSAAPDEEEDMWDVVNEIERGEKRQPARNHIPISSTASSGNTSRATNDDDWDEMYS
ncbi:replication fork protection component Swi3-domain-containing protein [Melanogaster broomeanus]|nr:replication fork protection component Swi3-domain-containing protein [Melanogaster broomeanus]